MSYNVLIREEAHRETQEAYDYYEQQRPGLGEEFLIALLKRYDDLAEHPTHYSFIEGQPEKVFRDAALERFPYVVVFEITGEEVIVYAVHDTRRQPPGNLRKP